MGVIVQKYGGTSLADAMRIDAVANRVEQTRRAGSDVVVVVSAMGSTTDQLMALAAEISNDPPPRELDMLLTAGERITMALLAMALDKRGLAAVSYTGSQAGILTDSSHGEARIKEITGERVKESLGEGKVVIVAGFQGVDPDSKEVTTLGRGGSDTTAVALSVTLDAEVCEIYTDVDGVFTADPKLVSDARRIDRLGYNDMISLAKAGAGVLAAHSVEFARRHDTLLHVRSSFSDKTGTLVDGSAPEARIAGLACHVEGNQGTVAIVGSNAGAMAGQVVASLADLGVDAVPETGDGSILIRIPAELIGDAMRLIHDSLDLAKDEEVSL